MPVVNKFRVILDTENDVFRDLELLDNVTFLDFHKQILLAFNFDQSQMASFYLSNDNWDKGQEITLMKMDFDDGSASLEMKDVKLKSVIKKKGQKLLYVYDFMNMWCFYIDVLDVYISEDKKEAFPRVVYVFGDTPKESNKKLISSPNDKKLMLKNMAKKVESPKNKKKDIFDGFDDFTQYSGGDMDIDDDEDFIASEPKINSLKNDPLEDFGEDEFLDADLDEFSDRDDD